MSRRKRRLVCVVEGKGEVEAVPNLCSRILEALEAWEWFVDPKPFRQPRGLLVSREGRPNADGLRAAIEGVRRSRSADAVLVLCDADDDCPATWGPAAEELTVGVVQAVCVMAMREYEAWLLASLLGSAEVGGRPIEGIRDCKGWLDREWPGGYSPTQDQLAVTRTVDVAALRDLAPSFDKLVRSLARVFGAPPGGRDSRR